MLVKPGTKKSRTETWVRVNGVGEVLLNTVIVSYRQDKRPARIYERVPEELGGLRDEPMSERQCLLKREFCYSYLHIAPA